MCKRTQSGGPRRTLGRPGNTLESWRGLGLSPLATCYSHLIEPRGPGKTKMRTTPIRKNRGGAKEAGHGKANGHVQGEANAVDPGLGGESAMELGGRDPFVD